tara:strand:- start:19457 stop:20059 length:603 start_codon:yes stop_codon:yes gene_type:complete
LKEEPQKNMMKLPRFLLLFFLLICFQNAKAQSPNSKWVAEVGASGFLFLKKSDRGFLQLPRIGFVRYASKGFSVGAGLSFSSNPIADKILVAIGIAENGTNLLNFDAIARYDFKYSDNKWVPFALGGFGLYFEDETSATVNFGGGLTYWSSPKIGIQVKSSYNLGGPCANLESYVGIVYSISNDRRSRSGCGLKSGFCSD